MPRTAFLRTGAPAEPLPFPVMIRTILPLEDLRSFSTAARASGSVRP